MTSRTTRKTAAQKAALAAEPSEYLNVHQVAARYQVSHISVWRWARETDFPKPIKLQPQTSRWRLADLVAWESRQGEVA